MSEIKQADRVRHKVILLNGGVPMNVLEINANQVKCSHFEGPNQILKETWFDKDDLEIIIYGEGGFTNPND